MVQSDNNLVDINLFFYNSQRTLNDVIASIVKQTWKSWRLLLIDNGSTDQSPALVEKWAARDERISVKRLARNQGVVGGLRTAFQEGNAPFVLPKTGDDILVEYFIERILEVMISNPGYAMCHSGAVNVDPCSGRESLVPPSCYLHAAAEQSPIERAEHVMRTYTFAPAFWGIYRREFVQNCLLPLYMPSSDHAFLAELSLYGGITHVREVLFLRDSGPQDIKKAALAGDLAVVRNGSFQDLFVDFFVHVPRLACVWAHVKVFSLAKIDLNTRLSLMKKARLVFQERWGPYIKSEIDNFRHFIVPQIKDKIKFHYVNGDVAACIILSSNLENIQNVMEWFENDI